MDLKSCHLTELRRYGKLIGVANPTVYSKNELLEVIKKIKSGELKPCFTKKGRPMRKLGSEFSGERYGIELIKTVRALLGEIHEQTSALVAVLERYESVLDMLEKTEMEKLTD